MQLLGQDPRQKNGFRNFVVTAVVISITGNIVPTVRKNLFKHLAKKYYKRNEKTEANEFLARK